MNLNKKIFQNIKTYIKKKFTFSINKTSFKNSVASGIKMFINLSSIAFIMRYIGIDDPIIIAPFASTSIIMYSTPSAPSANIKSIIFSYITASIITTMFPLFLDMDIHQWWTAGLIIGVHGIIMQNLNITHGPSAAIPISMLITTNQFLFYYLVPFYFIGSVFMVLVSILLEYVYPQDEIFKRLNSNISNSKK